MNVNKLIKLHQEVTADLVIQETVIEDMINAELDKAVQIEKKAHARSKKVYNVVADIVHIVYRFRGKVLTIVQNFQDNAKRKVMAKETELRLASSKLKRYLNAK